jgi:hypothetical protein
MESAWVGVIGIGFTQAGVLATVAYWLGRRDERLDAVKQKQTELDVEVDKAKSAIAGYARVEWRLDNLEETMRKRLGSDPRHFAMRPEPRARETTLPGISVPASRDGRRDPSESPPDVIGPGSRRR